MIEWSISKSQQTKVESGRNAARTQVLSEPAMDRHLVSRHHGSVVRTCGPVIDADREDGKVVEKEGAEVIAVEDDQHVGRDRLDGRSHAGVKRHDRVARAILPDRLGDMGRMRNPESCNNLAHGRWHIRSICHHRP
jgi:hypothetical protein